MLIHFLKSNGFGHTRFPVDSSDMHVRTYAHDSLETVVGQKDKQEQTACTVRYTEDQIRTTRILDKVSTIILHIFFKDIFWGFFFGLY